MPEFLVRRARYDSATVIAETEAEAEKIAIARDDWSGYDEDYETEEVE